MRIFGIAGHSGMGKTTLLERIIPELQSRRKTVSLIKHSHKDLDIDRPGKDSYRLRQAGCQELILMGHKRWALMHELREDVEPTLPDLLSKLQTCDLVLIEGFKQGDFPKLEVWRAAVGKPHLWPTCNGIVAMATDGGASGAALPTLDLSDIAGIADLIDKHAASSASMLSSSLQQFRDAIFMSQFSQ